MSDSLRPHGLQHTRLLWSITNSQSLLKLTSIESVMPTNHLILCLPFLLLSSIFPSIRVEHLGFPGGSAGKESVCSVGDLGSIPGLGRSPGEGKGYPLQCSGLESSMDCTVHGVAKSQTQLSNFHFWHTSHEGHQC